MGVFWGYPCFELVCFFVERLELDTPRAGYLFAGEYHLSIFLRNSLRRWERGSRFGSESSWGEVARSRDVLLSWNSRCSGEWERGWEREGVDESLFVRETFAARNVRGMATRTHSQRRRSGGKNDSRHR